MLAILITYLICFVVMFYLAIKSLLHNVYEYTASMYIFYDNLLNLILLSTFYLFVKFVIPNSNELSFIYLAVLIWTTTYYIICSKKYLSDKYYSSVGKNINEMAQYTIILFLYRFKFLVNAAAIIFLLSLIKGVQ